MDIEHNIPEDDAYIAMVVLWQDGEEVAYALRQGEQAPARYEARTSVIELDDIPF